MADDRGAIDSHFAGQVVKVIAVCEEGASFYAHRRDGQMAYVTLGDTSDLEADDVLIVGENRWQRVPDEVWTEAPSIGVVRAILDDELLVEGGFSNGLQLIVRRGLDAQVGNTIEFSRSHGVRRILSTKPIRTHDRDLDELDVSRFKVSPGDDDPGFEQFGGYSSVVQTARDLVETQLERKELLDEIGARPVKGVLFTGPPGTGKTMLAKILARESAADFFVVSGPEIVSKWVGDSEQLLRRIFQAAERTDRAIIFFDEIDSIAEKRSGDSHEATKRLVAQFLTELDGFDQAPGSNVVVIAATNRVDDIDPAFRRPGRFDWEIDFGIPSVADRQEILDVSRARLATTGTLPIVEIAQRTEGWTPAQLTSIWTEAALIAAKDDRNSICELDLVEAFERVSRRTDSQRGSRA